MIAAKLLGSNKLEPVDPTVSPQPLKKLDLCSEEEENLRRDLNSAPSRLISISH